MRIRPYSDLHLEFHRDRGVSFIEGLDPTGVDVLVLAGDICSAEQIVDVMRLFCAKFPQVVWVTGNHELYSSSRPEVLAQAAKATTENPNLHYLDKSMVEIDGVRFLGATLWFENVKGSPKHAMNDFRLIRGNFTQWVYKDSDEAVAFFEKELRQGDVLITHHLPSYKCVAPEFVGSRLNVFFVRDIEALILERKPAVSIFGHTHTSVRMTLGQTRMVCNPFGYVGYELNQAFEEDLIVEVGVPEVV